MQLFMLILALLFHHLLFLYNKYFNRIFYEDIVIWEGSNSQSYLDHLIW